MRDKPCRVPLLDGLLRRHHDVGIRAAGDDARDDARVRDRREARRDGEHEREEAQAEHGVGPTEIRSRCKNADATDYGTSIGHHQLVTTLAPCSLFRQARTAATVYAFRMTPHKKATNSPPCARFPRQWGVVSLYTRHPAPCACSSQRARHTHIKESIIVLYGTNVIVRNRGRPTRP